MEKIYQKYFLLISSSKYQFYKHKFLIKLLDILKYLIILRTIFISQKIYFIFILFLLCLLNEEVYYNFLNTLISHISKNKVHDYYEKMLLIKI